MGRLEEIAVALFAVMEAMRDSAELSLADRKLQHVNEWDVNNGPSGFQHQTSCDVTPSRGGLSKLVMKFDWYFYVGNANEATDLNELVSSALARLKPSPAFQYQTLGGVVENAYVEGTVELYEGVLQDRAVAIVPITVVAPN